MSQWTPRHVKTRDKNGTPWDFFLPDWVEEIQTLPVLGIVKSSPVEEGPGHTCLVCARIWLQLALAQTGTEKRVRAGARSSSKPRCSIGSPRESSEPAQLSHGRVHSLLGHSGLLWDDFSWPSSDAQGMIPHLFQEQPLVVEERLHLCLRGSGHAQKYCLCHSIRLNLILN